MSASAVLRPMRRCAHTGLTIPECSCPRCHAEQLRRYAPALSQLTPQPPAGLLGGGPLLTIEDYANRHGISPQLIHRRAQREEISF